MDVFSLVAVMSADVDLGTLSSDSIPGRALLQAVLCEGMFEVVVCCLDNGRSGLLGKGVLSVARTKNA